MTNKEQAVTKMFTALGVELAADNGAYAGNQDFIDEAGSFGDNAKTNTDAATAAHVDNSGFSAEKLKAKITLAALASNLSGKAYVKFINLGKLSIAQQLHIEPTDYKQESDSNCAKLAQEGHDLMNTNIGDLTPNTIDIGMLNGLQKSIDNFKSTAGSSDTVHETSVELTKKFKASFKPVMVNVEHLRLLARDYETSNNVFFTKLMASMVIPTINVHHTIVSITATAKSTGKAVENAVFTLTNPKKSGTTDFEGNAEIDEVKAGKDILTGVYNGAVIYTAHIVIKRGKTVHFDVVIASL